MKLNELERQFKNYVLYSDHAILAEMVSTVNLTSLQRLDVYREAYYLRLLEVIENSYPLVKLLLGEEQFDQLGRQYIDAYPSLSFNIRHFEQYLSEFLAKQASLPKHISEMARFEWMLETAAVKPDAPVLTFNELASLAPEAWGNLQLALHPSVSLLSLSHNVDEIYQAHRQQQTLPKLKPLSENNNQLVIWRREQIAYFLRINQQQAWMLQAMSEGLAFSAICQGLCQWIAADAVGQVAAQYLQQWISNQMISKSLINKTL